jgi:hypothetical protein
VTDKAVDPNPGGDPIKTIELVGKITGSKDMAKLADRVRDFDTKHKIKR